MMLEASVQWALLTALLLVMQSTPTLCGNNTTNTTTTTTAHLTTTAKINPKPTPKTTHTPRPPHTPFPSDGNFVELNFTLPNDSNGTASNTSMCATCATGVVPFAAAHALRQWSVAFTNPIPVGLGFLLDQVIATVYGAWPCATRKRFNDTASSVLLTINSVVVAETSLPTRNSSCDCRNCAEPLVFTGLRSAALWQNTYYQNNHLSIIVTSPEPIWFSFVDVRFHYSEPTDVVVYYTPIGGPISGDTNVTVLGDFEPGTLYNCYFGRVPSVAQPLQSDNGTSSYQVACLAPLSIADGRVRFSVIEATASADGRRKRRFLAQPAALPVRGGGGVERLPAAGDHVPPNAPGGGNFFHYYKKPTFLSFSPTSGGPAGGYDVNITGTNFLNFDSYMYCMFGEQPAIATYVSNTTVTCTAPGGMGSVHLMYSQNNQQFDSVGTFTYVAPLTSDTVYLSFLQVGLIAGGALLLVLILIAVGLYISCSKRQYTVLRSVGPDGEAEEQTINVAQIQLLARIGKGSFAEVFRATWRGSEIAVKKLPARAVDEEMRADFEGEAALMSRLRHPNCLQYLGSCNVPPDIWILTEYMPLGSLYQVLHDADLQLNWDVLLSMLNDTAKGVAYLHGHEPTILHRDLKSHNILVSEHWVAKVCDFGLSRLAVESHTMTACGTPCWTAPEVLRNQRYCFPASDHQLLTNRGFMFLDEVLAVVDSRVAADGSVVVRDWRDLRFAGYRDEQIVYEQPSALVVNAPSADGSAPALVGFAKSRRRWNATSDDDDDDNDDNVSLVVTPEHSMYVSDTADGAFKKRTAASVASSSHRSVRLLARARGGVSSRDAASVTNTLLNMLDLSAQQLPAFLELYGFWLGDAGRLVSDGLLVCGERFIVKRLRQLGLRRDADWRRAGDAVLITNRRLVDFFHAEYFPLLLARRQDVGHNQVFGALFASRCARAAHNDFDAMSSNAGSLLRGETVDGAKWLAQWVWQLSRTAVRSILAGLQASSGGGVPRSARSERCLLTASVRFRDELTRLMLHAGFATRVALHAQQVKCDVWAVWYGGDAACSTPSVDDVAALEGAERAAYRNDSTWCVTMPSGFVVARRAQRAVRKGHGFDDGERAVVVKASRPTIQGNCASADVYSFGIIAWECVTRSDPYGQMPPFQVIFAVGTQGARPAIPPDCPPEMTNLITSAWAEEPADRPSFTEIAVRISGIQLILCSGEPLPPTRLSRVNKSRSSTTNSGVEMHDNAADDATDSSAHISASALPFDDLDDGQLLKL